ncbi:ribosomal protein S5 domain 2-type protein [Glomus cerebriforme]|uniref:Ribosomal protein S5 domain 2-type protein n=1 Tax=Glomus cerebriforme TaxID=658196 RepID=A0A397TC14_9GLOM|nr:ribosomal protein S5 domain 2-type protein [Glomus cerebriforme]
MELTHHSYARVGLMGNPSDGFYGKTISLLISNFFVKLTLIPNDLIDNNKIFFLSSSNSNNDCNLSFDSLNSLVEISKSKGYNKENCLLQATCKVFSEYCLKNNFNLHNQGFSVHFNTNIPRQVGLAGSSAVVTAFWKVLMKFYNISDKNIPLPIQANLILSVEKDELNISAGLQDRVIQVYGGLMYMDFNKDHMIEHGVGIYERLDINSLPKELWIAYEQNPSDSGKIHSDVRKRYERGDQKVIDAMKQFTLFAEQARNILIQRNEPKRSEFAKLMNKNFDLRREIFGDQVLGQTNLIMIELARKHNFAAKFTGSGGAILGLWNGDDDNDPTILINAEKLKSELEKEGFCFCWLIPHE